MTNNESLVARVEPRDPGIKSEIDSSGVFESFDDEGMLVDFRVLLLVVHPGSSKARSSSAASINFSSHTSLAVCTWCVHYYY